jgi:uncharacterized protein (DUF1697 family)
VTTYVALLRGINVGGKNLIKMPALKKCFEAEGFEDVVTYIQSGNVLFRATGSGSALARRIETRLGKTFRHYQAWAVVLSHAQMRTIVEKAPKGFGTEPAAYLYDVVFLKQPLTASAALKKVPTREEVDQIFAGRRVLYFKRLRSQATRSRLNRVASLPIYQSMTIRNWNTTTRLLEMMDRHE